MYGSSIGTLNLYQKVGSTETLIWTLSGDKGKSWNSGQVPVGNPAKYSVSSSMLKQVFNCKDEMFICHEHGTKKNSESLTGSKKKSKFLVND